MLKLCSSIPNWTRNAKSVSQWILTKHTRRSLAASSAINARPNNLRNTVCLRRPNARRWVLIYLNSTYHQPQTCQDYLLTDRRSQSRRDLDFALTLFSIAELRDQELLPHLLKANPHQSTYANMMLFLRCQIEDFAWQKWGSPQALDTEWERRTTEKNKKKNKKFEEGLKELRKRTREGVWQRRRDEEHKHVFGVVERDRDGVGKQVCHECGFTIDVEEFWRPIPVLPTGMRYSNRQVIEYHAPYICTCKILTRLYYSRFFFALTSRINSPIGPCAVFTS